jgi:hypothetical protein
VNNYHQGTRAQCCNELTKFENILKVYFVIKPLSAVVFTNLFAFMHNVTDFFL